jgi:cytidylate kinase
MAEKTIITICRQFCSGGRVIGEKVAQRLGFEFYDKQLVLQAAKESGYAEDEFAKIDETATNSLLYSLVMDSYSNNSVPLNDNMVLTNDILFGIQSDIIKKAAENHSCVIVGRCADYVLKDEKNIVKVFIRADLDYRIDVCEKTRELPPDRSAEYVIYKVDKKRSSYYEFYSGGDWRDMDNYDIVINTAKVSEETAVNIICDYVQNLILSKEGD